MSTMKKVERKVSGQDDIRFKFERAGQVLEGYYLGAESFDHNGKQLTKHRFKDAEGKVVGILGTHGLNEDLPQVPVGSFTRITYEGKKNLKGGRTVNNYAIEFESNGL